MSRYTASRPLGSAVCLSVASRSVGAGWLEGKWQQISWPGLSYDQRHTSSSRFRTRYGASRARRKDSQQRTTHLGMDNWNELNRTGMTAI